ncbi:carbohydrate ABC transporter permease [Haploplasma axanthum]|uniref:Inner membrane ABC transporter permease protein ycjO n=1 Tax=Haploplasma axanthum TaxID=29552 RepID=A0A449BBI3_HAPAX|nr:sugar ABC transporter permease [Haploplasma axanthum]VEU79781.1 Inner membrane ABC transporter permease protein ycjO [Haploplasma axanthum]
MISKKERNTLLIKEIKRNKSLYAMMAPYLLIFTVFTVLPVIISLFLSFTSYDMLNSPKFVFLDNYINLLTNDDVFMIAFRNTFILAIIVGPVSYIASFIFAWLINELPPKIKWVMIIVFYAPSISGSAYLLWQLIFNGDMYGYLNSFLLNLGVIDSPILWLKTPGYALPIIIIVQLWLSLGVSFLSFVAGLQTVDKTLYEAAAIDGIKNRWQELWYVTLPQMKSQLMFGALIQITSSFSIGAISMGLLGFPSVEYSGHTIITHLLDFGAGSQRMELGYASAIATLLFIVMMIANIAVQKIIRRVGT